MKQATDDLLRQGLQLSPEERAALAATLIESLDQEVDEDAEAAWATEIGRRLRELDAGKVKLIPWFAVRRRIAEG